MPGLVEVQPAAKVPVYFGSGGVVRDKLDVGCVGLRVHACTGRYSRRGEARDGQDVIVLHAQTRDLLAELDTVQKSPVGSGRIIGRRYGEGRAQLEKDPRERPKWGIKTSSGHRA